MPPYILCQKCEAVPVTRPGELCEHCEQLKDKADKENERRLKNLEKKPRRVSEVM